MGNTADELKESTFGCILGRKACCELATNDVPTNRNTSPAGSSPGEVSIGRIQFIVDIYLKSLNRPADLNSHSVARIMIRGRWQSEKKKLGQKLAEGYLSELGESWELK